MLHLADAVYALALTADDEMIFVRQFRAGSRRDSLEPPGGLVDAGEDPWRGRRAGIARRNRLRGRPARVDRIGVFQPVDHDLAHSCDGDYRNARRVAAPKLDHAEEVAVEFIPGEYACAGMIDAGSFDHCAVRLGVALVARW